MFQNLDFGEIKILEIIKDRPMRIENIIKELDRQGINTNYEQVWKKITKLVEKGIVDRGEIETRVGDRRKFIVAYKLKDKYRKDLDETLSFIHSIFISNNYEDLEKWEQFQGF
jgi:predicted transcriptional regulator